MEICWYNSANDSQFPFFLSNNIPISQALGVFDSQFVRYARDCSGYQYVEASLKKFDWRPDLVHKYSVSVSQLSHFGYTSCYVFLYLWLLDYTTVSGLKRGVHGECRMLSRKCTPLWSTWYRLLLMSEDGVVSFVFLAFFFRGCSVLSLWWWSYFSFYTNRPCICVREQIILNRIDRSSIHRCEVTKYFT